MEITVRDLITVLHGMGFGALFMLAFSGALVELYRMAVSSAPVPYGSRQNTLLGLYLVAMVVLAWLTVFSGAYIVYPWYRAVPPPGATDLADYPRRLLLSSGKTSEWHNVGMEWKEHVAWLAPIAMTMVAYVTLKYRRAITRPRNMRVAVLAFTAAAFIATGVAGAFGAFLNKYAPVRGGSAIVLMGSER
jgi:hypothetical protein